MGLKTLIVNSLPTLIGVIVGGAIGLLSPWIGERLAQRKRKKELKYVIFIQ